jgi:hypothetical protein
MEGIFYWQLYSIISGVRIIDNLHLAVTRYFGGDRIDSTYVMRIERAAANGARENKEKLNRNSEGKGEGVGGRERRGWKTKSGKRKTENGKRKTENEK